jgi:hypothetical protein
VIYGANGNDRIYGGAGMDMLFGGADADFIDGGADNDLIDGGTGLDIVTGGAGKNLICDDLVLDIATSGTDYRSPIHYVPLASSTGSPASSTQPSAHLALVDPKSYFDQVETQTYQGGARSLLRDPLLGLNAFDLQTALNSVGLTPDQVAPSLRYKN